MLVLESHTQVQMQWVTEFINLMIMDKIGQWYLEILPELLTQL